MDKKINVIDTEIVSKGEGIIVILKNLDNDLENVISKEIQRQLSLGARSIKLCDKANNIDESKKQNYVGEYEFNYYTDFYLMRLPCKEGLVIGPELTLERLSEEKADRYVEVYEKSFCQTPNSATYCKNSVLNLLKDSMIEAGFVRYKGEYIGFYELNFEEGEEAELAAIGIVPEFRNKSLGKTCIEMINEVFYERGYKYTKLLVASINKMAFGLYKKMGFEISGEVYSRWYKYEIEKI